LNYSLAPHVDGCCVGSYVVLIDTKNDQYIGVPAPESASLASCINGWPKKVDGTLPAAVAIPTDHDDTSDSTLQLLEQLLSSGLLIPTTNANSRPPRAQAQRAERALIEGYTEVSFTLKTKDIARFVMSLLKARKFQRSFEIWVNHLRSRRADISAVLRSSSLLPDPDMTATRHYLAVFRCIRPFFYSTKDACLFDSMVLAEFLRHYRIFPQVILGVAQDPFSAHCWLQEGPVVLNDDPLHVSQFTPILVL
jgi:Transglutaminase-like superfamily